MSENSDSDLLRKWRRQVAARRRRTGDSFPRRGAALGYLPYGPIVDGLIEIENLLMVVVYDEPSNRRLPAIRVAGYATSRVNWGIKFGGAENSRFFKDLSLPPRPAAKGLRLNLLNDELLRLVLKLDQKVQYVSFRVARQLRGRGATFRSSPRTWRRSVCGFSFSICTATSTGSKRIAN